MSNNEEKSSIEERTGTGLLIIKGLKEVFKLTAKFSGGITLVSLIPDVLKEYENFKEGQRDLDKRHQILNLTLQSIEQIKRGALSDIIYYSCPVPNDYTEYMKEYIRKNPFGASQHIKDLEKAIIALHDMRLSGDYTKKELDTIMGEWLPLLEKWQKQFLQAWNAVQQENKSKTTKSPLNKSNNIRSLDLPANAKEFDSLLKSVSFLADGNESLLPADIFKDNIFSCTNDIMSYMDKISILSDDNTSKDNSTLGNMPFKLNYEISVTDMTGGLIQEIGENYSDMSELVVDVVQNIQTFNEESMSAVSSADDLERSMNEYKVETYSAEKATGALNTAFLAMNISGINIPFATTEKTAPFSKSLYDTADACGMLANAFINVDENISKMISSAGTLAEGVSGIFKAFEGDKVNGLGLMSGIQGGFAGLQGLFGGEPGSDMSGLLGGLGGMGAGVAGLLTGNPLEGIQSIISGLPSLIDGLTESTQEGYVKQLSKQGFNDTYSEDLLDKMSAVSDKMGDKSFGITAYIEDFFKETNIDNAEEFSRLSDYLNESIGEYVAQGHTMDEAYDKFGDELEQLTAAQEKYGFETTASLDTMIEIQKTQTKAGRIEGLQGALGGFDKIISGIEKQMKLTPDFKLSEASISGIAGSLTNTYQELLNQGMGASEAVDAVKPLLTEYADMAEKQGWDLSNVPGFSQLSSYFDSLDKASGALDMIQGSADIVKALSGSGMMDQATLESQGSLGLDVMRQLEASGLNDTQALQQMGGWLQQMQQASEKWGLSLSPDVEALIKQAEEKGVLPEEQKPVDEVIADGIETGFTRAIDVIDKYFGDLTEYGGGGVVPGSSGQKKLIWAHAGEAVGFPEDLSSIAANPELTQGLSGLGGMLITAMQNMGATFASMGGGTESIVASLQELTDSSKIDFDELQAKNMNNSPLNEYSIAMDRVTRQSESELAAKVEAERQAQAESNKLQIEQTIENRMKIAVNGRDFVNAIKQDIYDQLKEDSRRGMITIHDSAIKKY